MLPRNRLTMLLPALQRCLLIEQNITVVHDLLTVRQVHTVGFGVEAVANQTAGGGDRGELALTADQELGPSVATPNTKVREVRFHAGEQLERSEGAFGRRRPVVQVGSCLNRLPPQAVW